MGLFEYITDDISERREELGNQIQQDIISPILEKKFDLDYDKDNKLRYDNVTLDSAINHLQKGSLTLGEMMHFFNNIRNRAAYIKGSLFANDQNSDEQLQIEISLNSKYDGFNESRNIEFLEFPV